MTRFNKDFRRVINGEGAQVLRERKNELDRLYKKGKSEKNSFRREIIAQDYSRLQNEYNKLDKLI